MREVPARIAARLRAAAEADGADRSGLAALLWVHALQAAGDAMIAVALAGTVFFGVPLGQARGRVATYLALTLLPFALLVPVAGPLLDRFRHGRRTVLALTTGVRGLVAWSMAGGLASLALYPQALAVLVLARAYGVARSAAVVRVRPPALGLVASNARLNVAATAGSGLAAALGAGVSRAFGAGWDLRLASLLLIAGAVGALRLPAQVDEAREELPGAGHGRGPRDVLRTATAVRRPLLATVALRVLGGLLTVYLAFLLRDREAPGPVVALVLGAAVVGAVTGTVLASRLAADRTEWLTAASLAAPLVLCLLAAVVPGPVTAALAVGVSGLAGSLAKFGLDAGLQTHVPAGSRGTAFAGSETLLQLGFAVGGGLGVALSFLGDALAEGGATTLGFAVAAGVPAAALVLSRRSPSS